MTLTVTKHETSVRRPYEGRHRNDNPGALSAGGARAFVRFLGVGLMYRGKHRDNTPEAHERDRARRDVLELQVQP